MTICRPFRYVFVWAGFALTIGFVEHTAAQIINSEAARYNQQVQQITVCPCLMTLVRVSCHISQEEGYNLTCVMRIEENTGIRTNIRPWLNVFTNTFVYAGTMLWCTTAEQFTSVSACWQGVHHRSKSVQCAADNYASKRLYRPVRQWCFLTLHCMIYTA